MATSFLYTPKHLRLRDMGKFDLEIFLDKLNKEFSAALNNSDTVHEKLYKFLCIFSREVEKRAPLRETNKNNQGNVWKVTDELTNL